MISFRKSPKRTFIQRLRATAMFWGVPAFLLELIGIPRQGRGLIIFVELLATTVGVFIYTLIEWSIVRVIKKHLMNDEPRPK